MAHEATHHAHGDHHDHGTPGEIKSKTALNSSFWLIIIIAGLFIAAVNFIQVMGSGHEAAAEHGGDTHNASGSDHNGTGGGSHKTMEATSNQTLSGEGGSGRVQQDTTQAGTSVHADDEGKR